VISSYDAAYLLCAKRLHLALATRDKRLAGVARRSGIVTV
jgi:predicted nucleic acid-binding protein